MMVSFLLFSRFKKALTSAFDEQIAARAYLVAEKTNVRPKIVPLPQGTESFTILYVANKSTDTFFKPAVSTFPYPAGTDSIASGNGWRTIHIERPLDNGGRLDIFYALPSAAIEDKIRDLSRLIWLVLPVGCLLAFLTAYWLSSRLLKPVRQVMDTANAINLNTNTELLPAPAANDELKELIVAFNRMLLRIKEQSDRQTAFFASASHELRTPLSIMQTRLQVLLQEKPGNPVVRELYEDQLKEVKQLNKMVSDFLLLSELRSGKISFFTTALNLPEFILGLTTKYREKAMQKGMHFKVSYLPAEGNFDLETDEDKLAIITGNLLENAIKYSPLNAVIELRLTKTADHIVICFANPIRDDINPELTDLKNQFYHSKPIHGEGFGLGLWIASQLATMQQMELYCLVKEKRRFEASLVCLSETES